MHAVSVLGRSAMQVSMLVCVASLACALGCSLDRAALEEGKRTSQITAGKSGGASAGDGDATSGSGASGEPAAGSGAGMGVGTAGSGDTAGTSAPLPCGGCDDGVFCNGAEICMPSNPAADARGCIVVDACLPGQACEESATTCMTDCTTHGGDADGDGFVATACGGDDCNDASLAAYPDGVELCDGLDNDCSGSVDDGFAQFSCLRDKTLATCVLGQCVITMCETGYGDCDTLTANGCETELDMTPGDCKTNDCIGGSMPYDADVPLDDDNECTVASCSGGMPFIDDAPNGTGCGDEEGTCENGKCK